MARLFIAVTLSEAAKRWLAGVKEELSPFCRNVKWVEAENYHLTLKFLGETSSEQLPGIRQVLAECARFKPPAVGFQGAGVFPGFRQARVIWAGVTGGVDALAGVAAYLDERLAGLGFVSETRGFRPHLTLGRFRVPADLTPYRAQVLAAGRSSFGPFPITSVHLMESQLTREGPRYTELAKSSLTGV